MEICEINSTPLKKRIAEFVLTEQAEEYAPPADYAEKIRNMRFLCGTSNDLVNGFAAVDTSDMPRAKIYLIVIKPSFRMRGGGAQLIRALERWMRRLGYTELSVSDADRSNYGFFTACGFKLRGGILIKKIGENDNEY